MTDAEALQRFILATAELEPDLSRWAAAAVWRGLTPSRRRRIRDDLLRQAARMLPPVSAWQKAHLLAELAERPGAPGASTAAGLVALAVSVYCPDRRDRELSARQVFRILTDFAKSPIAMAADAAADSIPMLGIFPEREDGQ